MHNPHQFENTPITYSQSFTKNPIPQFYYSEPRRSFPTVTLASTPERMQQQKGADPGCVQDFRHIPTQPNVGVQVNSDPDRNKQTRAHCMYCVGYAQQLPRKPSRAVSPNHLRAAPSQTGRGLDFDTGSSLNSAGGPGEHPSPPAGTVARRFQDNQWKCSFNAHAQILEPELPLRLPNRADRNPDP